MKKLIVSILIVLTLLSISMIVFADDPCDGDSGCDKPVPYPYEGGCMSVFVVFGASGSGLYFERKRKK
jgi:hypothetical protein